MKPKFKKQSAIELAGDSFVIAIGRPMVAFAGIEGALNFCRHWSIIGQSGSILQILVFQRGLISMVTCLSKEECHWSE